MLVLACTHYPILADAFARARGDVALVDPAIVQAEAAARLVVERGIAPGRGEVRYVTTKDRAAFVRALEALAGAPANAAISEIELVTARF